MFKSSLALMLCLIAFNSKAQHITGVVIEAGTNEAVPFAKVELVDYHFGTTTDSIGTFQFEGKFAQTIKIRVSAFNFETIELELESADKITVYLKSEQLEFNEVTVTASRNELKQNSVSHVELRSIEILNKIPTTNLGQAIETIPGVYNASTGNGISKPVIRGFQGTRVISMINGVRIENQQWGGDHGMGLSELGIGTVEVLKGPASLLYGADALGGVIYYSDEGFLPIGRHELKLSSMFESNALATTTNLIYNGSMKKVRILAGGRFVSQADYQLPNGSYVKNSRFSERAGKLSLGWSSGKWVSNLKYSFSESTVGIPGHTHDSLPITEDFLSEKQLRKSTLPVQHFTNHYASFENKWLLKRHKIQLLTAFTSNKLVEFEEKISIPALLLRLNNIPYKFSIESKLVNNWSLDYGIQGMIQDQMNDIEAEERLLPNANQFDNGVFLVGKYGGERLKFQVGGRIDSRILRSYADTVKFFNAFEKSYFGYNFATGVNYSPNKKHIFRANVSSGFRVPHLSELLSNGVHHGTFRYEIGRTDLRPERAYQLDLTYEFEGDHLSLIFNPFTSLVNDYIFIQVQDSIIDGTQVFTYNQTNQVTIYGGDIGFHYHPHFAHLLHLESTFSTISIHSNEHDAISLIPPTRINTSAIVNLEMKSKFAVKEIVLQYSYYFPQNNVSTFESTSVDYGVLNLGINTVWDIKTPIELQFGVRNLTNTNYINHLSRLKTIGLENPGRNIYFKLLFKIQSK